MTYCIWGKQIEGIGIETSWTSEVIVLNIRTIQPGNAVTTGGQWACFDLTCIQDTTSGKTPRTYLDIVDIEILPKKSMYIGTYHGQVRCKTMHPWVGNLEQPWVCNGAQLFNDVGKVFDVNGVGIVCNE